MVHLEEIEKCMQELKEDWNPLSKLYEA
jgi:hypothetical protein